MDQTTRKGHQLEFAKVCVNLAADCGFPTKIRLYPNDDPCFDIGIKYLNKPSVCSKCEVYGHDCNRSETVDKKWVPKIKSAGAEVGQSEVVPPMLEAVSKGKEKVTAEMEFENEPLEVSVEEGQTYGDLTLGDSGDHAVRFVDVVKGSVSGGSSPITLENTSPSSGRQAPLEEPPDTQNPWITAS
ncbi:unnamed protein product [Linum trigynum]|uniref:Uncharacterized protein n=1 Tax=Linum trigynum TaxID=586398 RepID=A0AAV2ET09_9ROSI